MQLVPDWKWILTKAWSVRVLALLAALDFVAAIVLVTVDGAASSLIADNMVAVVVALAIKSLVSVLGIWLRVKVQKEAEEIEGVPA